MTNPTILITGASRGLGAAAARTAAQQGANVVLTARSRDRLERVAQEIRDHGGAALVAAGDVTREGDCKRIIDQTLARFAGIHALINNSGTIEPIAPVRDADPQAWEMNWAVNVLGPVMLTRLALPSLRENQGRVVNVSSGAAVKVTEGWAAYALAKAALNHFTRFLAVEEPEITALAFRPGMVDTAMQAEIREKGQAGMPQQAYARFVQAHRQGKLLPPDLPGRALAGAAFFAPHDWSGEFISWDEPRLQQLIDQHWPG